MTSRQRGLKRKARRVGDLEQSKKIMAAIHAFGIYVPKYRITVEEIARQRNADPAPIIEGLGIFQKAVAGEDEDSITMAVEASRNAISAFGVDVSRLGAVHVGSESKPYSVKPSSTVVATAIGAPKTITAADFEFACKAGTEALQACIAKVNSGMCELALAAGSDTAQARPGCELEYTAASGAAAFIVGPADGRAIATIEGSTSIVSDTPDFWRRSGRKYPEHAGRFTGEPAYFTHTRTAVELLLKKTGLKPADFDHAVFHMPNAKFPKRVAKMLGFTEKQIEGGLIVPSIGNTYAACSLMGLARVLDIAKKGERILMASFGSGAGSDAFSIIVDKESGGTAGTGRLIDPEMPIMVSYSQYARMRGKIITEND